MKFNISTLFNSRIEYRSFYIRILVRASILVSKVSIRVDVKKCRWLTSLTKISDSTMQYPRASKNFEIVSNCSHYLPHLPIPFDTNKQITQLLTKFRSTLFCHAIHALHTFCNTWSFVTKCYCSSPSLPRDDTIVTEVLETWPSNANERRRKNILY